MNWLYTSPLRVYLTLGALCFIGVYAGFRLPISLFPNSLKPKIIVSIGYGGATAEEFLNMFGKDLENQFQAIKSDGLEMELLKAYYNPEKVNYELEFKWGGSPQSAIREVEMVTHSFSAQFPLEIRESIRVWTRNDNTGFFAASFYSATRGLDDIFDHIEPLITPALSRIEDADSPKLWNPFEKEISIELDPKTMASLQLFPMDVEKAIAASTSSFAAGSITLGPKQLTIQMPRLIHSLEDLRQVVIPIGPGKLTHLGDIAKINLALKTMNTQSFKTSGAPSIILYATPKANGNVKRMSDELNYLIQGILPILPKDIQVKTLVDPSEFIRASITNVIHEVGIGALLAVAILFFFVGNFRNTFTAAIEIPLSMVLAFILMKFSEMNLNLISLGGLALSAGMNVDASVVVMENIFRHFEKVSPHSRLDFNEKLKIIVAAVKEVRFPVIASTICSLVVFLPLSFTSDLSFALLGDLAKVVVFSHGLSMFVALILVPTVRLHLMKNRADFGERQFQWNWIIRMEFYYGYFLSQFLKRPGLQKCVFAGVATLLILLMILILPRLPKEAIGRPDTDWIFLSVRTQGNTNLKQMESQADEMEAKLLKHLGSKINYTFTQVRDPNRGSIMARLHDKRNMASVWKEMEIVFSNTPFYSFFVGPWNPAELPIPDPPHLQLVMRGGTIQERVHAASELKDYLEENKLFDRIWSEPRTQRTENVILNASSHQWKILQEQGVARPPSDLADLVRVVTTGKKVGSLSMENRPTDIVLKYPDDTVKNVEELGAFPIGANSKLLPLRALTSITREVVDATVFRENRQDAVMIFGKNNEGSSLNTSDSIKRTNQLLVDWKPPVPNVTAQLEDPQRELNDALSQLAIAAVLSFFLIFLTLILQFGSITNALLVMIAIPLGMIGVLISLFFFKSTLSLNSVLGMILLSGIAVANSIILVSYTNQLVDQGESPNVAAILAAQRRLRPILITSLTTVLGMLPIALGLGEGGRILQPLGIAVSGGLWMSMGMTLFLVPALQVFILNNLTKIPGRN